MTQDAMASIQQVSGAEWKAWLGAALENLRRHREEVNALNVFPVPDGDTGANMVLTMQAAWKAIEEGQGDHVGEVMQHAAYGAIRGARGNSGVILSQIFRGMAEIIAPHQVVLDASTLARAFRQGQRVAYQGVMQPVEGTILTIIRAIADASEYAAALHEDVSFLLTTCLNKAREALAQTPELLPVLQEAGVVDAGGAGLVYLLEGMTHAATGQAPAETSPSTQPQLEGLAEEWGYDIQFLIHDAPTDETTIRLELAKLGGESIVVGRAGRVTKVHVHGANPGPFLTYGASLGPLEDIVVENMTLQTLRRKGAWPEAGPAPGSFASEAEDFCAPVVAVAPGEGFAQVFRSLGACHIVAGGQTMNPSTEELLWTIERVPEAEVLLLPNNKNILMAARQAAEFSNKRVFVVASRTPPQGVAAMLAYNPHLSAEENALAMEQAMADIHTIEITRAVRKAALNGVDVQQGQIIAMVDGALCCSGEESNDVAWQALGQLLSQDMFDVVTIYVGQPVEEDRARELAQTIAARHPDVEVEVIVGGQPHYHYIISVE